MDDIKTFEYGLNFDGKDKDAKFSELCEKLAEVKGVLSCRIDGDSIIYDEAETASDYDIFVKLNEFADALGITLLYGDENASETVSEVAEEESADADKEEKTEEEKKEEKAEEKKNKKADFIEKCVTLGLSLVLIAVGAFLGRFPDAQMWLYMFSFALSGYEILYEIISKLLYSKTDKKTSKNYVFEDVLAIFGGLVLLYSGHRLSGAVVALFYAAVIFACKLFETAARRKRDEKELYEKETDEAYKAVLKAETDAFDKVFASEPKKAAETGKKRFLYDIVILSAGLIIAFVPPFFKISSYGKLLTETYLYVAISFVVAAFAGGYFKSVVFSYYFALAKTFKDGVRLGSFDDLDEIAGKSAVVFDKTGVLTETKYSVVGIYGDPRAAELLRAAEENSSHPIAAAITEYVKESAYSAENATEYDGKGVKCEIDGKTVICGSLKFLKENGIEADSVETDDSAVYVAENGEISGVITFGYKIAENAAGMIREITEDAGLKTILLSGDQVGAVDRVKKATAVSKAVAGASVKYKEEYISKNDAVYVGNGIYDKTLAENAKCVIAIGNAEGKTAVADGDLRKVPAVIKLAKRTRIISKQNRIIRFIGGIVAFSLAAAMKIAFGYELLWLSAIVLALSDVAAFFNSARNITETV